MSQWFHHTEEILYGGRAIYTELYSKSVEVPYDIKRVQAHIQKIRRACDELEEQYVPRKRNTRRRVIKDEDSTSPQPKFTIPWTVCDSSEQHKGCSVDGCKVVEKLKPIDI